MPAVQSRRYALLIASNGTDSRVGSLTSEWERFFEWKRIEREDEPRKVSLEVMLRGTCDRARLLDLIENFTLFSEHNSGLIKIIGQNHQVLGVNAAIQSLLRLRKPPPPEELVAAEGHYRGELAYNSAILSQFRACNLGSESGSVSVSVSKSVRGRPRYRPRLRCV